LHKKWNCTPLAFLKINQLTQFRDKVYQNFNNDKRTDMLMDLADALRNDTTAKTAAALTLNPHFRLK
jgi:hypothetical protein